jgi:hypothetical protein
MIEQEFNDYLDYLDEYWSLFGPIPFNTEAKVIEISKL